MNPYGVSLHNLENTVEYTSGHGARENRDKTPRDPRYIKVVWGAQDISLKEITNEGTSRK